MSVIGGVSTDKTRESVMKTRQQKECCVQLWILDRRRDRRRFYRSVLCPFVCLQHLFVSAAARVLSTESFFSLASWTYQIITSFPASDEQKHTVAWECARASSSHFSHCCVKLKWNSVTKILQDCSLCKEVAQHNAMRKSCSSYCGLL